MNRDLTELVENRIQKSKFVTGSGQALSDILNKFFQEGALHPLKLFLNGTWLEHPLHPLLTDVPVGAWTASLLIDLVALVFAVQNLGLASAIAIGLGVIAALAAIATGFMDWMDVDPPERAVGFTHALINIVATIFFLVSFLVRLGGGWNITIGAFAISLIGYLLLTVGAFLGGSLVYRMGTMVNRNAYRHAIKDFTPAMADGDLPQDTLKRVEVKSQPVLLVRHGEQIFAVGAVCSHYGAPLEKGKLKGDCIECPFHYSLFSLADGRVKHGPSTSPLPAYQTRVNQGQIEVKSI